MTPQIFADAISQVHLANGVLRIELVQVGADNQTTPAGSLVIPANQVQAVVGALARAVNDIGERMRQAQEQGGQGQGQAPAQGPAAPPPDIDTIG